MRIVGWVRLHLRRATPLLCSALALAACGDDPAPDAVAAAEAAVADAEEALADATSAFCADAEDYLTAVDRYGKAFDDRAATVGDVTTAGADLVAPREAASAAASEAAAAARDLADAEEALAEARAARSGSPAPSTTTTTSLPAATVDRVERAEQELATATEGIAPETSLTDATEQLNAAAFAVEAAGLRLLADAGCLTDDQEQRATAAVTDYTADLQSDLQVAGYYDGSVDGIYGPATVEAVGSLQADAGLPVTGLVDQATSAALDDALQAQGDRLASAAQADTAGVQAVLKVAGFWTGPLDGEWTPELTEALAAFQTALGVPPSGAVDAATLAALEQAIADAGPGEEPEGAEGADEPEPTTTTVTTTDGGP
jgi:peptidoglycan hydrolase-like protein with peptidoglycan-binding domain